MEKIVERRLFRLDVLVFSAADLPGQWIGHCLDLDIVSQGNSPEEALRMIREATEMSVIDAMNDGLDPKAVYKRAPERYWARFKDAMDHGTPVDSLELEADGGDWLFAISAELTFIATESELRLDRAARLATAA